MLFLKTVYYSGGAQPDDLQWRYEVGSTFTDPTWDATDPFYGKGLHGLKNGVGDFLHLDWWRSRVWIVFEAFNVKAIHGTGKNNHLWKSETAVVKYKGTREGAMQYLFQELAQDGIDARTLEINGANRLFETPSDTVSNGGHGSRLSLGDNVKSKVGYRSFVKCGFGCTLDIDQETYVVGGNHTSIRAEHYTTMFVGDNSDCLAGFDSLIVGGTTCVLGGLDRSQIYCGENSTVRIRNYSLVTGRDNVTVYSGHYNDITVGNNSTVYCNTKCLLKIGQNTVFAAGGGTKILAKADDGSTVVGYVKHLEIEPLQKYRLNAQKVFEKLP